MSFEGELGQPSATVRFSWKAIVSALDVLGPVSKQRLLRHLKVAYGMDIRSVTPLNLDELNHAIEDIFGEAAAKLLMQQIYAEICRLEE